MAEFSPLPPIAVVRLRDFLTLRGWGGWRSLPTRPSTAAAFLGGYTIDNVNKGPALETAQNWRAAGTIWTDGSRLDSGAVGAACAWQTSEGWDLEGRHFHLGTNKEVFGAEVYAIYQALRIFEERHQSGRKYTIFSDFQPTIRRALSDALGPGQQWARAIIETATRLISQGNEVLTLWVPTLTGVRGNEVVDGMTKEAVAGLTYGIPDRVRWQASLPHLSRRVTERWSEDTSRWIRDHVRPERHYVTPGGPGFRKRAMRRVRKPVAQRYYQLLPGHAATGSFLQDRMTGPQRLEAEECWWCSCGKRQWRHHLFAECQAWAPQIRELWQRVGKDCVWEHLRAPALRWLWKGDAVGAAVEFLENTRVGSRASAEMMRARLDEDRDGDVVPGQGSEDDGPGLS